MTTVALVGNPNSGKTTLFNALTGTHQRVGNWPGVTVEQKTGWYRLGDARVDVVDLPGVYSLSPQTDALDERIAVDYLTSDAPDVIINVVDAATLARGLYLTRELLEQHEAPRRVVIALNMMDVAERQGMSIDIDVLAAELGVPVVPLIASRGEGVTELRQQIDRPGSVSDAAPATRKDTAPATRTDTTPEGRYAAIDTLTRAAVAHQPPARTATDRIDAVVLNRYLAFPIFLAVMYLMFTFTITLGSAFIDLFDLVVGALIVEAPRSLLGSIGAPDWLIALVADGFGGGVQLVATFIPVIGCMFLFLSFLEDSGYMGRVAFIIDRALKRVGLPGKSFVPLIVGFGCNVPAVMATRTLDNQPDRILTTLMAPFMSCGARLTVYALFATAFFPRNGQNVVFALYLIGVAVAVVSALIVRKHIVGGDRTAFVLELPAYHLPNLRGLLIHSWHRLKGFVLRAGKAIVAVVIILNVVNSVGTDGSFGNQDTANSMLSEIGRTITPALAPIGVAPDNWPATVGIFTGIFAKEVVVGTLDALYQPRADDSQIGIVEQIRAGFASVPANLAALGGQWLDPLGLSLGDLANTELAAADQGVMVGTLTAMQQAFSGPLAAFSYLLFILLYMPCVATVGAIHKEIGPHWAWFSTGWSFVIAYAVATLCFQLGSILDHPIKALTTSAITVAVAAGAFYLLIRWGRTQHERRLIPLTQL